MHPRIRRPFRPGSFIAPLLLVLVCGAAVAPAAAPRLAEMIDRILQGSRTGLDSWGIYMEEVDTGQVLYTLNGDHPMVPASNQKLLTTAVALDVLGADYRYQTTLYFNGVRDGGVIRGDLIIEGSGDPTFGTRALRLEDPLEAWAEQLAAQGVTRFEGRIIGDDSIFDDVRHPPSWEEEHVTMRAYAPAASGLSYHDNLVTMRLYAVQSGALIRVETTPPGYLDIQNSIVAQANRRRRSVGYERIFGTETVILRGAVPRNYRAGQQVTVYNPATFTIHSFERELEDAGIRTSAELLTTGALYGNLGYKKGEELFVHYSPPLADILAIVNKESDNFYAEQVFRTISWGGTLEGGERQVRAFFERAHLDAGGLVVRDGSGLSRENQVTPEAMGQLLAYMYNHPERDAFLAALPHGGERRTTMESRLHNVSIQAKTGTLDSVRSLSGYTTTSDGRQVAFSIFANDYNTSSSRVRRTIDEIVETLATSRAEEGE